jgi:hypothetical protein
MVASMMIPASILAKGAKQPHPAEGAPWYRRTYRWGQTNITEEDPATYDVAWWREHWERTRVQGVILPG